LDTFIKFQREITILALNFLDIIMIDILTDTEKFDMKIGLNVK